MIVVLKEGVKDEDIEKVRKKVEELGYQPHVLKGMFRTVINCIGDERGKADNKILEAMEPVEKVLMVLEPYKLASKTTNPEGTKVPIGKGVVVGGEKVIVIAGPCSVESENQIMEVAQKVKEAGAHALRGGAFKPRTAPYSFQGLGKKGLEMLAEAGRKTGLPIVTEVMSPEDVKTVAEYADVLQVGARNVQNFPLLKKLGKTDKPVLLKRGLMTTIEEFLLAAEYILAEGNPNVILCERGIRTFETATRNTLDISAIPVLKKKTHLPVIVDPSHATGYWEYVPPMCYAAIAAGADGLIVEVHPNPEEALSDGTQSLKPEKFKEMMENLSKFVKAVGRKL
jgi:3-deoxy-7-phosphoheptulonate synthase